MLHPLPVTRLGGVGPATAERLHQVGVRTVADLASKSLTDLVALAGRAHGAGLYALARAEDDRAVVPDREAKSVSHEETFERDLTDLDVLGREIDSMAARVGERLRASAFSGRTVTLKLRRYDFTTLTRSQTLPQPTDDARQIASTARRLLADAGARRRPAAARGRRLGPVGLRAGRPVRRGRRAGAGRAAADEAPEAAARVVLPVERRWWPGQDVVTRNSAPAGCGAAGLGRVTVRFEGPRTAPGPVRTLAADDPLLQPADPPDWRTPA